MIEFKLNGKTTRFEGPTDTPLLWILRDDLEMTGTKFGCGAAQCGACTVHVNGVAVRSCQTPAASLAGQEVTTIEGLSEAGDHPVQLAWVKLNVPQCGYCQPGQIMQAASLLARNGKPSDADIDLEMSGNICRCGTYPRIRQAIHLAAEMKGGAK
ncbi:(2Fe-2S)-binding protein [Pelagicoccus mobilis]|uniref:(2Fe-2S)-binding protein n=1 Tax=Pelagicoccus mobilis TaxID=415221 RepID=A0A934VRS5_9BACT|nr:(2Fe-2S)-binding protein [Pelagicoccus mobilis]MBK1877789.1 (2Fe-2S)-binding protein [Pelagicoccus mobilis]